MRRRAMCHEACPGEAGAAVRHMNGSKKSGRRLRRETPLLFCLLSIPRHAAASPWDGPTKWGGARAAKYEVVEKYQHDRTCFSEGFSFVNNSQEEVIESCGLTGRSYIRRYNLKTGKTLQQQIVPSDLFGEGLVAFENRLYLLTYKRKQVLEFDGVTWELRNRHSFVYGEGWGLTTDGCHLLATTGSSYIYRFQAAVSGSWEYVSKVQVKWKGSPVSNLNELEYVTPKVWVNIWHTNTIWRVDPSTGECELKVLIGQLYNWRGEATPNGIAYSTAFDPQLLVVTGKNWPQIFALRLSTEDLCGGSLLTERPGTCALAPPSACWRREVTTTLPKFIEFRTTGHATSSTPTVTVGPPPVAKLGVPSEPKPTAPPQVVLEAKASTQRVQLPEGPTIPTSFTVLATILAVVLLISAVLLPMSIRRYQYRALAQGAL